MGVYIYGIRSPKQVAVVEMDNGSVITVAKYAYAYKPISFTSYNPEPKWQILAKARLTRMANIWNKYVSNGGSWAQAGVVVDDKNNISVGSSILKWSHSLPTSVEDCTFNGAQIIGKVVRVIS
jgi:hypothetical protein